MPKNLFENPGLGFSEASSSRPASTAGRCERRQSKKFKVPNLGVSHNGSKVSRRCGVNTSGVCGVCFLPCSAMLMGKYTKRPLLNLPVVTFPIWIAAGVLFYLVFCFNGFLHWDLPDALDSPPLHICPRIESDEFLQENQCRCPDPSAGAFPTVSVFERRQRQQTALLLGCLYNKKSDEWDYLPNEKREHVSKCMLCDAQEDTTESSPLGTLNGSQTFIDEYILDSISGIERFIPDPIEVENPIIQISERWEGEGLGFPGSINHNGSHFILHYRTNFSSELSWNSIQNSMGVATSKNGSNWQKQQCIVSKKGYGGYINWGVDACVLYDEWDKNPSHRFKMVYNCSPPKDPLSKNQKRKEFAPQKNLDSSVRNLDDTCIATSPDGITWTDHGRKFGKATDTQPCLSHHGYGENYTLVLRKDYGTAKMFREIRGTQFLTIREDIFQEYLPKKEEGTMPFEYLNEFYLDYNGKEERYEHQLYTFRTTSQYNDVHIATVDVLHWPRVPSLRQWKRHAPNDDFPQDNVMTYLATSRDGIRYNFGWIYSHVPLPLGKGLGFRYIAAASQILTLDGYHWLFYSGNRNGHRDRWKGKEEIRLAKFPVGRLSGLRRSSSIPVTVPGLIRTRPFLLPKKFKVVTLDIEVPDDMQSSCEIKILGLNGTNQWETNLGTIGPTIGPRNSLVSLQMGKHTTGRLQENPLVHLEFQLMGNAQIYSFNIQEEAA